MVKTLERQAKYSQWNFLHKLRLLEAEIAYFLRGDKTTATRCYAEAIELASKHKFKFDHALALERMSVFCSETGEAVLARDYSEKAETAYRDYGATRKADAVRNSYLM
mmetsp:Transcript_35390/g.76793  ORF Transcript_35390/g.76793 Transcript_35390/m.76793 type:complete len:108 (+) Transcript_35390:1-324(+)